MKREKIESYIQLVELEKDIAFDFNSDTALSYKNGAYHHIFIEESSADGYELFIHYGGDWKLYDCITESVFKYAEGLQEKINDCLVDGDFECGHIYIDTSVDLEYVCEEFYINDIDVREIDHIRYDYSELSEVMSDLEDLDVLDSDERDILLNYPELLQSMVEGLPSDDRKLYDEEYE